MYREQFRDPKLVQLDRMQAKQAIDDKELDLIILEAIESVMNEDLSESETRISVSTVTSSKLLSELKLHNTTSIKSSVKSRA